MGETTLQDHRLASHTSSTYTRLKDTALSFIDAQKHNPNLNNEDKMDFEALRSLATQGFTHSFGPTYSVSQTPKLQGSFDFERFKAHLESMLPHLETWDIDVRGVVVDEVGRSAVVRAMYRMFVKGKEEGVENDVVWWLEMEEHGDEWKVRKSTEMVDFGASKRIAELMMAGKGGARKDSAAEKEE